MNKELSPLESLKNIEKEIEDFEGFDENTRHQMDRTRFQIIETALKQAQEDKEMLNIFKNVLTIERDIPPELEIKESEKGCSYVFKEAVKIHENRIEEMLKKSLREWVLKNAFPKEIKALEIIKEKRVDTLLLFRCFEIDNKYGCTHLEIYNQELYTIKLTQKEYKLLKEVLKGVLK